jgi:predicted RNA-binding protein (virulence factor B family)
MHIGRFHTLPVWTVGTAGVLLGDRHAHVILPAAEAPQGLKKGDRLRVFVTTDSEDQLTATLREPAGQVGDLVMLPIVDETPHGVFAHWGLSKDLFIPWKHMHERLAPGDRALVYIALDLADRPVGWTKLVDLLVAPTDDVQVGQEVSLVVYGTNDVGVLCAVDGRWSGLLYHDRLHGRFKVGDRLTGYVERVRDDEKLDLSLVPVGRAGTEHATDVILEALEAEGGFLPLTDRSDPELIRRRLGLSKKQFKKAVGGLYKARRVRLENDGIRRV